MVNAGDPSSFASFKSNPEIVSLISGRRVRGISPTVLISNPARLILKLSPISLDNSIIFLSATNKVKYNIGFNRCVDSIYYDKKEVLNAVDYIIKFNDISEEVVNKYIEYNGIKNFDLRLCDYKNYGFRGVKIGLNGKNIIK